MTTTPAQLHTQYISKLRRLELSPTRDRRLPMPRARGEAPVLVPIRDGCPRSPPRARGCTQNSPMTWSRLRVRPAHAGMHRAASSPGPFG